MKGSRNRTTWRCSVCKQRLYSWRAWSSHLWDKHNVALLRKVRLNKEAIKAAEHIPGTPILKPQNKVA